MSDQPPASTAAAATCYEQIVALESEGVAFVLVVLVEALGSTPQDAGAKMVVTGGGRHSGTIGGGRIEVQAIAIAQEMLAATGAAATQPRFLNWSLRGDLGMTCGGSVKLYLEPHPGSGDAWPIVIFGAGHVAQALVPVLLPLPCSVTVCDSRSDWLEKLPRARNLRTRHLENPADLVPALPEGANLLCMTMGHTTDRPILERALNERNFPFIAVIGSDAKAAVLRRELVAAGVTPEKAASFHCPAGLDFGTNYPHEIALSIAAQLLQHRDRPKSPAA